MVEAGTCTEDERRTALNRAITSRTFARSEQLRSFLRYVCEAELRGRKTDITEYAIGVEVLHRPPGYSPAEDSSVRTRAYELRQKLEKLYSSELPNEVIRIVVPKGTYAPQFIRLSTEPDHAGPEVPSTQSVVRGATTGSRWPFFGLIGATALLAAVIGAIASWAITRKGAGNTLDPVVTEAWKPFAKPNDTPLLVAATPLYLVLGPETHGAFETSIYPAPPEAYDLFRKHRPLAPGASLGMIFTNDALGVGSMNAVVIASNTLRAMGATPQILPERAAMMSVLHGRDTILFGAPVDSQAISEILDKTPLSVVYDESIREFVVRDRLSGKTFAPEKKPNGDFKSVYGLVTVLHTRESDQGRLGMIVFSGITSVGTHGAAEYFASPRSLKALRALFGKEGVKGFPAAYQVVVKCSFENMLLVAADYQYHEILRRD
jgi:hypothetical protein